MKKTAPLLLLFSLLACLTNSCSKPIEACFTCSATTVSPNTTISFNASCSENVSYFTWRFGDNSADTTTTSPVVAHTFSSPGQFNVSLVAKRKDGPDRGKDKPTATALITVQ